MAQNLPINRRKRKRWPSALTQIGQRLVIATKANVERVTTSCRHVAPCAFLFFVGANVYNGEHMNLR